MIAPVDSNQGKSIQGRSQEQILTRHLRILGCLVLFAISVTVFMGKSYERSLQAMDSSVHARLALDVTADRPLAERIPISRETPGTGPGAPGHWGEKGFNDHPFTLFWLNGKIMRALGPDAFSARLLPTLFSVGCVFVTLLLGWQVSGSFVVGWSAALLLAATPQFISYGSRFHLDTPFIFFLLLSFLFWLKRRPAVAGLAVAASLWIKAPMGLLLYPSALLAGALTLGSKRNVDERAKEFAEIQAPTRAFLIAALLGVVGGALYWLLLGKIGGFELVRDYWVRQVFGTAVEARGVGATPTLPVLKGIFFRGFPGWLLWIAAGIRWFRRPSRDRAEAEGQRLFLAAIGVTFVIFCVIRFKYEHYLLPLYPFVALVTALGFRDVLERFESRIVLGSALLALVVLPLLIALPVDFGREKFPQLRAFMPIIQSEGDVRDRVLFVEGSQPYGGIGDYSAQLIFYTNRRVLRSDCARLSEDLQRDRPEWVILGEDELSRCFPPALREKYPSAIRYGDQILMSSREGLFSGIFDLKRREVEGRAQADSVPPHPRSGRYFSD